MLRVWVTGRDGQLGSELYSLRQDYPYLCLFTSRRCLDLSNSMQVEKHIIENKITIIINCVAYTQVDVAEKEPDLADAINHKIIETLSLLSKKHALKLVHISTDYVFDGNHSRPYLELNPTNPLSIYGKTKRRGEEAMLNINPKNAIIIRTSWLYSTYKANFVKTIIKKGKENNPLKVIFDQIGTPTYAHELAKTILEILPMISNEQTEIYHYSNEGVASWYDFAIEILNISKIEHTILPITSSEFVSPAPRPFYSVLDKSKIKSAFNLSIPYWKESLKKCILKLNTQ